MWLLIRPAFVDLTRCFSLTLLFFLFRSGWPARVVATSTNLERMIDGLCSNRQTTKMVILVSARIRKISFHVRLALGIQALKIVRCGVISNSSSSRPQPLMIEGRSRFNEVRFEDWGEESRDSCLVLGPNVYIGVDEDGESAWARRYRARTANALAVPTEDMQNQHAHDQTGGWSIFSAALCVGIGSAKFGLNMGVGYAG